MTNYPVLAATEDHAAEHTIMMRACNILAFVLDCILRRGDGDKYEQVVATGKECYRNNSNSAITGDRSGDAREGKERQLPWCECCCQCRVEMRVML